MRKRWFTLKPYDLPAQTVLAESLGAAQAQLGLVSSQVNYWSVKPTAKQIRRSKSAMRGL